MKNKYFQKSFNLNKLVLLTVLTTAILCSGCKDQSEKGEKAGYSSCDTSIMKFQIGEYVFGLPRQTGHLFTDEWGLRVPCKETWQASQMGYWPENFAGISWQEAHGRSVIQSGISDIVQKGYEPVDMYMKFQIEKDLKDR